MDIGRYWNEIERTQRPLPEPERRTKSTRKNDANAWLVENSRGLLQYCYLQYMLPHASHYAVLMFEKGSVGNQIMEMFLSACLLSLCRTGRKELPLTPTLTLLLHRSQALRISARLHSHISGQIEEFA